MKEETIAGPYMDGCVVRKARKPYPCTGDGTPNMVFRKYAPGCKLNIETGTAYMEFEPLPHAAGSRHCMACAVKFFLK